MRVERRQGGLDLAPGAAEGVGLFLQQFVVQRGLAGLGPQASPEMGQAQEDMTGMLATRGAAQASSQGWR